MLKGGDQGAKLAEERRFKRPDSPRVLICTAAGLEGTDLQFARVLFNTRLAVETDGPGATHRVNSSLRATTHGSGLQRRLGRHDQGQIYLLLEEKLLEIAKTLGKVDELGQVAEELRGQILGQLSERLSYDKLYQDAVRDPRLVRTRQELEVAIDNAQSVTLAWRLLAWVAFLAEGTA